MITPSRRVASSGTTILVFVLGFGISAALAVSGSGTPATAPSDDVVRSGTAVDIATGQTSAGAWSLTAQASDYGVCFDLLLPPDDSTVGETAGDCGSLPSGLDLTETADSATNETIIAGPVPQGTAKVRVFLTDQRKIEVTPRAPIDPDCTGAPSLAGGACGRKYVTATVTDLSQLTDMAGLGTIDKAEAVDGGGAVSDTFSFATPGDESFSGSCTVNGSVVFDPLISWTPKETNYVIDASGRCSGKLDGVQINNAAVTIDSSGTGNIGCEAVEPLLGDEGGALEFTASGKRIDVGSKFAGGPTDQPTAWWIVGAGSGSALGKATFHPPLPSCFFQLVGDMAFEGDFSTATALKG